MRRLWLGMVRRISVCVLGGRVWWGVAGCCVLGVGGRFRLIRGLSGVRGVWRAGGCAGSLGVAGIWGMWMVIGLVIRGLSMRVVMGVRRGVLGGWLCGRFGRFVLTGGRRA